jgi:hypothetical protein
MHYWWVSTGQTTINVVEDVGGFEWSEVGLVKAAHLHLIVLPIFD